MAYLGAFGAFWLNLVHFWRILAQFDACLAHVGACGTLLLGERGGEWPELMLALVFSTTVKVDGDPPFSFFNSHRLS